MKVLVTGTHFTPAQAVIEVLHLDYQDVEIVYVGRKHTREGDNSPSLESQEIPKLGVRFISITAGRLQRSFTIYTIPSLLKVPIGFIQSFYYLLKEQPDVILSFGGYVAVPLVISAWVLSIPIIIHEQTLVTGLANKITSHFADKIAVSFEKDYSFPKDKIVVTGNPIRKDILKPDNQNSHVSQFVILHRKLPLILITGGNQGSHVINQAVYEILDELTSIAFIIHQTGDSAFGDFEKLLEKRNGLKHKARYLVTKWLNAQEIGIVLGKITLAVSRAGANTLSELAYFGVHALVIPIPYLYKNEQMVSAKFFEKLGLVTILPQEKLNSKNLLDNIQKILNNINQIQRNAKMSKSVVIHDAAHRLALETISLALKKKLL